MASYVSFLCDEPNWPRLPWNVQRDYFDGSHSRLHSHSVQMFWWITHAYWQPSPRNNDGLAY